MPTPNPRINITLDKKTAGILAHLAAQEHKSVGGFARELIEDALERHEDMELSKLAEIRDLPGAKRIKHDDAWK